MKANIESHIVGASQAGDDFNALRAVKLIDAVTAIIRYRCPQVTGANRLDWARLITRPQFLVERHLTGHLLASKDDVLYKRLVAQHPESVRTVKRIRDHFVNSTCGSGLRECLSPASREMARMAAIRSSAGRSHAPLLVPSWCRTLAAANSLSSGETTFADTSTKPRYIGFCPVDTGQTAEVVTLHYEMP